LVSFAEFHSPESVGEFGKKFAEKYADEHAERDPKS
jgi:hypothetical protein